jgi:hypothetical protein
MAAKEESEAVVAVEAVPAAVGEADAAKPEVAKDEASDTLVAAAAADTAPTPAADVAPAPLTSCTDALSPKAIIATPPVGIYPVPLHSNEAVIADEQLFMQMFYSFHTSMKNHPS